MKKGPTIFLQVVIVLIGIGALALMLWEPHIEGRNANATLFEIYFKDPFLAYAYFASIPFFVALYQAFKVLGYIGQNKAFSQATVKALRTIKFCALAIIGFVAVGELFIMLGNSDDRAGGVFMGILITFGSAVIATAAAIFERILQNAVDIKSENDLTCNDREAHKMRAAEPLDCAVGGPVRNILIAAASLCIAKTIAGHCGGKIVNVAYLGL